MLSEEDISSQDPPQNMMCRMLSEENKSSQDSPRNVAKQLPSQNLYNTQLGHEVGICMSSRIFVCYSDSSPVAFTSLARSWTISDIGGLNSGCRWIQRLIMSANRDNAFSEHCPRIDGSTILDRDSMS
jgi:hypothetical protein